jgi:ribose 5-phosphate isomerase B
MTIHLATDHGGLAHKDAVAKWLQTERYIVEDHGAYVYDAADDYPDYIVRAALAVSREPTSRAIIFGGSGQGEAMLSNRFPHVRATVLYSNTTDIVTLSREHNDANVLSVGARFISVDDTKQCIWQWLHTDPHDDPKYARRNQKLDTLTRNLHL